MIIKFTNYTDGIHEFRFDVEANKLGLPIEFNKNVQVLVSMDKSPHQIVLDCELLTSALLQCDRCIEPFDYEIKNSFRLIYMFKSKGDIETESLNLMYITHDETKIDISEEVKEYCLLGIPLKILCKEDCKGLCSTCGINLNYESCNCKTEINNPIWEKLKKLKE